MTQRYRMLSMEDEITTRWIALVAQNRCFDIVYLLKYIYVKWNDRDYAISAPDFFLPEYIILPSTVRLTLYSNVRTQTLSNKKATVQECNNLENNAASSDQSTSIPEAWTVKFVCTSQLQGRIVSPAR